MRCSNSWEPIGFALCLRSRRGQGIEPHPADFCGRRPWAFVIGGLRPSSDSSQAAVGSELSIAAVKLVVG